MFTRHISLLLSGKPRFSLSFRWFTPKSKQHRVRRPLIFVKNASEWSNAEFISSQSHVSNNKWNVAGYSFVMVVAMVLGPIVFWPIADIFLLPSTIAKSLKMFPKNSKNKANETEYFEREFELQYILQKMKEPANDIWILTGCSNSGKTELMNKLQMKTKSILYIDLRHFFDGNSFVFEMIDALYNHSLMFAVYVKLFVFVSAVMAQSQENIIAMMYFHAMLNHLKSGLQIYSKNSIDGDLPLIIFDHFEALPAALLMCVDEKKREMLQFVIYSLSQFSSVVCHDCGLAHVLFVGNESFASLETYSLNSNIYQSSFQYFSNSMINHSQFWSIAGVGETYAQKYIEQQLQKYSKEFAFNDLNAIANEIVSNVGTLPINLKNAISSITSNVRSRNENVCQQLIVNAKAYIAHKQSMKALKKKGLHFDLESLMKELNDNDNEIEWNHCLHSYFQNDELLLRSIVDAGVLFRRNGKLLPNTLQQLLDVELQNIDDNTYVSLQRV